MVMSMHKRVEKQELRMFVKLMIGTIPICYFSLLFLTGTFMSLDELADVAGGVFFHGKDLARIFLLPQYPTGENLKELLLDTPGFYVTYWNSFIQTAGVLIVQCLVSIPAAFGTSSVILMTSFFLQIPEEMIEAARVDGASELTIFCKWGYHWEKGESFLQ